MIRVTERHVFQEEKYRVSEKERTLLGEKLNNTAKQLCVIDEERRELQVSFRSLRTTLAELSNGFRPCNPDKQFVFQQEFTKGYT